MKQWSAGIIALCVLWPFLAVAQDDEPSLGELARDYRKQKAQQQLQQGEVEERAVIDNENLAQAMEDAKNRKPVQGDKFVLSIDPAGKTIKASSPDVTCSMSFNGRASALLIKPVLLETLPLPDLVKLDGPASIQDENLQLEIFNGTEWDLREITVGLTLERKPGESAEMAARARVIPAAQNSLDVSVEKRSDVTLLYHLKATAKPFSTATFKEKIGVTPGPDEDWRWSIVEAKGIRVQEAPAPPDWLPPAPTLDVPSPLAPAVTPPMAMQQGSDARSATVPPAAPSPQLAPR